MSSDHDRTILTEARNITVRAGTREILNDVTLSVARGEIVTLIGPNGAGKTTLLRVLLGILSPAAGEVWRKEGLRIGYVPQKISVDTSLPLTVGRYLSVGRKANGAARSAILAEVGAPQLGARMLHELSGGEFRRILLARALLRDPELLILDEPVQGVDVGGQLDLYDLVSELRTTRNCGILMVSHDLHLVMSATDRVLCLNRHICCAGRPEVVMKDEAYVSLFGQRAAAGLAVYSHRHDHVH
ncbi:MAG: ATP-binding cassette domain-containing protein [bacterium]